MILELPAPKEVSLIWDLNLFASSSSDAFFTLFDQITDRQSATEEREKERDMKIEERERERERERDRDRLKMEDLNTPMQGTSRL